MAGLGPQGLEINRFPEIKAALEADIRAAMGVEVDFDPSTPDGQLSGVWADAAARIWAIIEDVYQSQYPDTASGISLDRAVSLNSVKRLAAAPTVSTDVVLLGFNGLQIPAGKLAKNVQTGDLYALQASKTVSMSDAVRVDIGAAVIADNTAYSITIGGTVYSITSGTGATASNILTALQSALPPIFTTSLIDTKLSISWDDPAVVTVSDNVSVFAIGSLSTWACTTAGRKFLPVGVLSEIVTPLTGWTGIYNRTDGLPGREAETDAALRLRREQSLRIGSSGSVEAIFTVLAGLENVTSVQVYENNTDVTDGDGTPAHHVWVIISGGSDTEIAGALFRVVSAGIGYRGDTMVNHASDITGLSHPIRFDRPSVIPVYITADITTDPATFPANGVSAITRALVDFGLSIDSGDTLFFSRLYTALNSVPGHYVTGLRLDTSYPPSGQTNITAAKNERIAIAAERVEINVNPS